MCVCDRNTEQEVWSLLSAVIPGGAGLTFALQFACLNE